jgi:RNA polymerase sigma factor (sigma-70 family)
MGNIQHWWPGPDDKSVVEEMLAHPDSPHWEECYYFVRSVVQRMSLSPELKEEVAQATMIAVMKDLPRFQFKGKLQHWVAKIARNRGIDGLRLSKKISSSQVLLQQDEDESEAILPQTDPLEELSITREKLRRVVDALEEYIQSRRNPERNKHLIQLVLFEGKTCEEAAKELDMASPLVHYYIRSVRHYLREKELDR